MRALQIGTGDRSEKIKTYNYKDSRMSDHRIKANFDLDKCMNGGYECARHRVPVCVCVCL